MMNSKQDKVEIIDSATALSVINRTEIDMQVATAKQYPRDLARFNSNAMALATQDEETAGSCFYKLPRADKILEGPSVRLAEIVVFCWQNIRAESRVIGIDEKHVVAQSTCIDLENNTAVRVETKRRITNAKGQRYNDDMIQVTANAAVAIAFREAVFKVVPRSFIRPIYEAAKRRAIGDNTTLAESRTRALSYLAKHGVMQPTVLAKLGRATIAEVTLEDLETLRGLITAIKEGEVTIDNAFAQPGQEQQSNGSDINERIKAKKAGAAPARPAVEDEPDSDTDF